MSDRIQRLPNQVYGRKLTDSERATLIESLKQEALADCKASGCTCEPKLELTEKGFGPHSLPMVETEHADDCGLAKMMERGGKERGLMIGSSIRQRLGI